MYSLTLGSFMVVTTTETDVFNLSGDMTEPNSGNQFNTNLISLSSSDLIVMNNRDRMICGYLGPSMGQGDTFNLHPCIHDLDSGRISESYTLRSVLPPEKDTIGVFSYDASYPASDVHVQDRCMEGVPLSATSSATLLAGRFDTGENLEQSASSAPSAPLLYPLEVPRSIVPNYIYNIFNSSSQTTTRYGHDGLSVDTSSKWDFSNFAAHPELAGIVRGRTDMQPFDSPSGSSRLSNELSLSLATSNPSVVRRASIQDQCSEICCSSSPYERCMGSEQTSCSRNLSSSFGSYRPVQLSQFLSGLKYISVIQEILAEIALFSLGNLDLMSTPAIGNEERANVSFSSSCTAGEGYPETVSDCLPDAFPRVANQVDPVIQRHETERKKKQLLALLQMVDDRYNECLDEIHTIISAFHAVTELDPPIHTRFVLQTISLLYKNLRERISNHILAMGAHSNQGVARKEEKSFEASFIQKQWALQQLRRKDNQLWRPQRGLPERSVSVLRAWMFQNFLHPYPKDAEKHLLAVKSGLTRSQVSNWFINARVRLWKPMIEEMYSEMHRRKGRQNDEESNSQQRSRRFTMH